jgi:hypothetical protein
VNDLDERRKPLAVTNPLLAKESVLLPEPSVEDLTFEHLSLNLPSIAVNVLEAVDRIGKEEPVAEAQEKAEYAQEEEAVEDMLEESAEYADDEIEVEEETLDEYSEADDETEEYVDDEELADEQDSDEETKN